MRVPFHDGVGSYTGSQARPFGAAAVRDLMGVMEDVADDCTTIPSDVR
jgi:hypothetical protein